MSNRIIKKKLCWALLVVCVVFLGSLISTAAFAQGSINNLSEPIDQFGAILEPGDEVSFSSLGFGEQRLYGPYDNMLVRFGIPADWELTSGAALELDLSIYYNYRSNAEFPTLITDRELFSGLLRVVFNDQTISTILLDERGTKSFRIDFPEEVLLSPRDDGRHELQLELYNEEGCVYDVDAIIVVHPTSRLILKHKNVPIPTDLVLLPRPIYQEDSIIPDTAVMVVPDRPSEFDLQGAVGVAAGLGRLTNGGLEISLVREGQLTTNLRNTSHLIFVGKFDSFSEIGDVDLPFNLSAVSSTGAQPEDGIIALAVSPWNSGKAVLVVGSETEVGVVKSAQALSSGFVMGIDGPDLTIISDTLPAAPSNIAAANRTLADLGYVTEVLSRVGIVRREYEFYIPPGQVPYGDTYFDIYYAHSTLLRYERSGFIVELNGEPVGSVAFSEDTAEQGYLRVTLPKSALRAGINRIFIEAGLFPWDVCAEFYLNNIWLKILSTSLLHVPLIQALEEEQVRVLDMDFYPEIFSLSPSENSVSFILPSDNPTAWNIATQIAFDIGDNTFWTLAESGVYFSGDVPEEVKQNKDLIIIGQASSLPIIAEISDNLPAHFENGSDVATLDNLQIIYRFSPTANLGYLELIKSPWNANRAIFSVLGSTDLGLELAGIRLTTPDLRSQLAGDFGLIFGDQVITVDSINDLGEGVESIPPGESGVDLTTPGERVIVQAQPAWILPTLIGAIALILVVLLIAAITSIRKRRI